MKLIFQNNNLIIYNSIFEYLNSNMYIIIKNNNALIIDPHKSDEVYGLLQRNLVKKITILLTHEHPDHVSGLKWLKSNFETTLISTKETSEYISDVRNTRPVLINLVLEERDRRDGTNLLEKFNKEYEPYTCTADITFEKAHELTWQNHNIKFIETIGHSKGSCCIILDDYITFTGDSLMKDYPIITRFPRGSKKAYQELTMPIFEKFPENMIIFPGHGKIFPLKDIKINGKISIDFK